MLGIIRKRDVLAHPWVTIRCFGWRVFVRTLLAGRRRTFLSVISDCQVLGPRPVRDKDPLGRPILLELRAEALYEGLARKFAAVEAAREFFSELAAQERDHADLLEVCRAALRRGGPDDRLLGSLVEQVPRLEEAMARAEASASGLSDLREALRLTIAIESSEVNRVFQGLVAACGSDFAAKVERFGAAARSHLSFLRRWIPEIDPALREECDALEKGGPVRSGEPSRP